MRAIWSGSISFGLVNIPVKLYSAVGDERLDFDMLHRDDLSPIRFARFCRVEEKEVPYEEIVKGFEYEKGRYVVITDEDFERANVRVTHAIVILDFVDQNEIEHKYFEKPYYLEPDKGADRSYALMREALNRSGKIGIGKFVLRNREHLIGLRSEKGILVLEQLRFASQIRKTAGLNKADNIELDEREVEMALDLINRLSRPFKIEEYKDTYTNELKKVIAERISGKTPSAVGTPPLPTPVPDLMEMLRKSLEEQKGKSRT
ncbi:MAG: Ku protein [Patescibacteria group bacterium]